MLLQTAVVILAGIAAILANLFLRISIYGGLRGGDDDDSRAGAIFMLLGLVAAILAPIAATLIRLAISRRREFLADASGILLTRYPEGLASALEKIAADRNPMQHASNSTAHLFIFSPFRGRQGTSWFVKLFMTHPPVGERVNALRGMEV